MKILIYGAGAIGSYIGGSLASAGHEIVFIERSASAARMTEQGIRLELTDGSRRHVTNFRVFDDFAAAGAEMPFDLAIPAVKSFDTESLLASLTPYRDSLPPFLSLQNGVENEARLAAFLGDGQVIPATVCTAIGRREQGLVKVEKLRGIGIADGFPLSEKIAAALTEAGLKGERISDAVGMKWSKMISNLMANASSAILNMTPAEIFSDPISYRLELAQLRETLQVMQAHGIHPVDIPGIPIRLLSWGLRHLPDSLMKAVLKKSVGSGRGGKMPSLHIDLYAGRKQSEVDYLNGAVVRYASIKGISVPVNRVFQETLHAMAAGEIPIDRFDHQPNKLARLIRDAIPLEHQPVS